MQITFKIKRKGSIFVVKASIREGKVTVTHEPYNPHNPKNYSVEIRLLRHDKDVIIKGDTSKRAKGREEYVTGISALKRWKALKYYADMPFKKYSGYRHNPTNPQQALQRTRVVWDYLSKYGGNKGEAHIILGMPPERHNCTLCSYVQEKCSELSEANCTAHCPVEWYDYGYKREGDPRLLCYEYGSPFHTFNHLLEDENLLAAKKVLDLIDLAIHREEH